MTDSSPVDPDLKLSDFDYYLPPDLIAQEPPEERAGGRMLIVDRSSGSLVDSRVAEFPTMLREHDLVVVNNTRVIPARLRGRRASGGAVEVLLLNRAGEDQDRWRALARPTRKLSEGTEISFTSHDGQETATGIVLSRAGDGEIEIQLPARMIDELERFGEIPLPPYIHGFHGDIERYQTVFSSIPGSAAAPTAGLHLTEEMFGGLRGRGVEIAYVTLQIGLDTFRPVTAERVADHVIHSEWCVLPAETAAAIAECRKNGGRVVAIGTTSARTLETWGNLAADEQAQGYAGWTSIFITPGYRWTTVDAMLTNFHLPRSTLLMMISSLIGADLARAAYMHAVQQKYRFFSFGDAMLIV